MTKEQLENEMSIYDQINDKLAEAEIGSEEYQNLFKQKKQQAELIRYLMHEDPETIKAMAEQEKVENDQAQAANELVVSESEGKKNRIWGLITSTVTAAVTGVITVGLMYKGHQYQNSEIFDRYDEKQIDNYQKRNQH